MYLATLPEQVRLCLTTSARLHLQKHPQRGGSVFSCHVWFIPFLMMLFLFVFTFALVTAFDCQNIQKFSLNTLWHYGGVLCLLLPVWKFWKFGKVVHCEHVKSQHSMSSLCLHGISKAAFCQVSLSSENGVLLKKITTYASFFLFLLLLRAGDVETNPGPPFPLVAENLSKVLVLVLDVSTEWFNLGLQLGIKEQELERIENDYHNAGACLREALSLWLKMINPSPTWEVLLHSLCHPSVGQTALAQHIREKVGITDESSSGDGGHNTTPKSISSRGSHLSYAASEAFRNHFGDFRLAIDDPELLSCALNSVNCLSDEAMIELSRITPASVQQRLGLVSQRFIEYGLSPDEMLGDISMLRLSTGEKKIKLIRDVTTKIIAEPEKFVDFLVVMKNSGPSLRHVAEKMEETHRQVVSLHEAVDMKNTVTSAIDQYAQYLKQLYVDYIFPVDEWPPILTYRYINLALIHHESIPKPSEIDEFMRLTLHGTVDDIHYQKQAISIEHIFKPQYFIDRESERVRKEFLDLSVNKLFDDILYKLPSSLDRIQKTDKLLKGIKMQLPLTKNAAFYPQSTTGHVSNMKGLRLLLDGAPGVGKTTLCYNACKNWAEGKVFKDFKLMVYVPLRESQVSDAVKIEDLFCYGPDDLKEAMTHELIETDGRDVLLILDGWDELPLEQRKEASLFCKIIQQKVLSKSTVLITSRPYASNWLSSSGNCNRHVEIFGLTEMQIKEYVQDNLKHPKAAQALLEELEIRSDVRTLCYVPMNLAMILYLFKTSNVLPNTLTGIFDSFTNNALIRFLQDYDSTTEPPTVLKKRSALPGEVKLLFDALCNLAYDGLMKDQLVFTKEELDLYNLLLTRQSSLGLLKAFKGFTEDGVDMKYQFLHLTVQEFLAAEALVQKPADIQSKFIFEHLGEVRFRTMIRFFFGRAQLDDIGEVTNFLCSKASDPSDNSHFLFLCHMLYEAQNFDLAKVVNKSLVLKFTLGMSITLFDAIAIGKFLSSSSAVIKSLNMYDAHVSRQELQLLTSKMSHDCDNITVQELFFETRGCTHSEIAPFLLHPVFHATRHLKIDICNDPDIASSICSTIVKMPSLQELDVHFRAPVVVDTTVIINPEENSNLALQRLFEAISTNPKIGFLKLSVLGYKKPDLLDQNCSMALVRMIESRETSILLQFDLCLYSKFFFEHFSKHIAVSRQIKELHFRECYKKHGRITAAETKLLLNAMKTNMSMDSLQFHDNKLMFTHSDVESDIADCAQAMEEMLSSNRHLKQLKISRCQIQCDGVTAVANGLLVNQTLSQLYLDNIDAPLDLLVNALAQNCTLTHLALNGCHLHNQHEPAISSMLLNGTLESLDLSSNEFGDPAAVGLFTALQSQRVKLEKLCLGRNQFGGSFELAAAIEQTLDNNQTLKHLSLANCNLHSQVIESIATSLASNNVLQSLNLQKNNITNSGMWQVLTSLQVNTCLKTLRLRENITLDPVTLHQLIQALNFNSSLEALYLECKSCSCDEAFVEVFSTAMQVNSSLNTLKVTGIVEPSQIDIINIIRLKEKLPLINIML